MSRYDNDVHQPTRLRGEIDRLRHVRDSVPSARGEVGARERHEELSRRIAYLNGVLDASGPA